MARFISIEDGFKKEIIRVDLIKRIAFDDYSSKMEVYLSNRERLVFEVSGLSNREKYEDLIKKLCNEEN